VPQRGDDLRRGHPAARARPRRRGAGSAVHPGLHRHRLGQLDAEPGAVRAVAAARGVAQPDPPAARRRYALGVVPTWRLKAALKVDLEVKPQAQAMSRMVRPSAAAARWARTASTRWRLTHSPKLQPQRRLITPATRYSGWPRPRPPPGLHTAG